MYLKPQRYFILMPQLQGVMHFIDLLISGMREEYQVTDTYPVGKWTADTEVPLQHVHVASPERTQLLT